jgi:hypothetical protein
MMSTPSRYVPPTSLLNNRVAVAFIDNVGLLMTTVEAWSNEELITVMEQCAEIGGRIENPSVLTHYFGEPYGGKASHRKILMDWQTANNIPPTIRVATLTDSVIMRGALTAYSWIAKTQVKPFKTAELDDACQWITTGENVSAEKIKEAALGCYRILGVNR